MSTWGAGFIFSSLFVLGSLDGVRGVREFTGRYVGRDWVYAVRAASPFYEQIIVVSFSYDSSTFFAAFPSFGMVLWPQTGGFSNRTSTGHYYGGSEQ